MGTTKVKYIEIVNVWYPNVPSEDSSHDYASFLVFGGVSVSCPLVQTQKHPTERTNHLFNQQRERGTLRVCTDIFILRTYINHPCVSNGFVELFCRLSSTLETDSSDVKSFLGNIILLDCATFAQCKRNVEIEFGAFVRGKCSVR